MGRSPCCSKEGLSKGAWTSLEDKILTDYITANGEGKWRSLPKRAGLKRCGKSCRLRWLNYLRPDIKRGNITDAEEDLIIRLHKLLGNRWSLIAGRLPGRTDNEIKNYWNTNIGKRVQAQSNSNRKPATQPRSKKNLRTEQPAAPQHPQNQASTTVVRTKATRCTKVFINTELQHTQQPGIMEVKGIAEIDFDNINNTTTTDSKLQGAGGIAQTEDNSSDFMMDFVVDDNFLSDILDDTQFAAQPYDFEMGSVAADYTNPKAINTNEDTCSSPKSCQSQNAFFNDQETAQNNSDLGYVVSLLDPTLDWLQDA